MTEMEQILHRHAAVYPAMQPTDAVKLIYQNEFGGGHLIADPQACLQYLLGEYASIEKDAAQPLTEDIGNGIVRVYLAAMPRENLPALADRFIRSAAEHTGNPDSFRQKLAVLRQLTEQGCFSFGIAQLEEYLTAYAQAGYPPASHSPAYKEAYHPAYRVILKKYALF